MKYDGTDLRVVYRAKSGNEQQWRNDIYNIYLDRGFVWVCSKNGLLRYDPKLDSIIDYSTKIPSQLSTSSSRIYDLIRYDEDHVWVATRGGVDVINENKDIVISNAHDPEDDQSLSSSIVTVFFRSRDGQFWVGTKSGLNLLIASEGGKLKFKRFLPDKAPGAKASSNSILSIQEDQFGNLWVGTEKGLYLLDVSTDTFETYGADGDQILSNQVIQDLEYDHKKRLWVGTYDGLNVIDSANQLIAKIRHDPKRDNSLSGNSIRDIFCDREGGIWVASYFGGINYWDDELINFEKIGERSGTQLSYSVVSAIVEDDHGKIYFGTEGTGLNIYEPNTDTYIKIDELAYGNSIGTVKALLYEGDDKLWIGTFHRGLIHLDLKSKKFKEYRNEGRRGHSLTSDQVLSIAKASDGKIWAGTLNKGLNLLDPKTDDFMSFHPNMVGSSISSSNVRALLLDKSGALYVGTGRGLNRLSADDYRTGTYRFDLMEVNGVEDDNLFIHDLFEDNNGRVWLGAHGRGLYYVDNDRIEKVDIEGLTSVFGITQEKDGDLWMSSEEGVVSYNTATGEYQFYNKKDGVNPNEFNRATKLAASNGMVYFGGASGVTAFYPNALGGAEDDYAPNVVLTSFSLFGKRIHVNDGSEILNQSIEYVKEVELDYDQNLFTIDFNMPVFLNPDKTTYRYRLIGLDDNWVTTANPSVSFTIQRGGTYTFEVIGVNGDGIQTEKPTTLTIIVHPAPWLTTWAYLLYAIIVLVALFAFIYFFKSRLRLQHQLEMESREFLHQQEVNKQKLQFFTNISHEFRTPLTLISGPLERLIDDYKGPSYIYRQLLVIKKNTDQLFKLINELMDFRKLENQQMKLQAAEGNIVSFAKEIFLSFDQQAKINKLSYSFHSENDSLLVYFDRDKLEKVLYNLISNAFKFTPAKGKISVSVINHDSAVSIKVKDSGEGISADHLEKIFDRFYEVPKQGNKVKFKQGSGIGLAIAKSVMDLHQGELKVESTEGKGSSFIMGLRVGRGHLSEEDIITSFKNSEDISQYISRQSIDEDRPVQKEIEPVENEEKSDYKILVVEDNEDISKFIYGVLNEYYHVTLANNGANGYQEALALQPNLIISDVMMPIMDGIEFCAKIKSEIRTSHIPFILLTARTSLIYKYDGLESGADEYLSKPFDVRELLLKSKNMIAAQERLKSKFSENGEFTKPDATVSSMDEVMMGKAVKIIKENIGNEFFSIQLLCDKLGISRSLLFTKFKAWTNQTPNDYVLTVRMQEAASLIEQGKVNISEVGYKVGFKSANYFSKTFKKFYSMSPKAYSQKFKDSLGVK
ncbi:hybrid sensor histidine kinase/response regulator transcription factor [Reichenbachiella ulvae]|uniref:histidine kinase n=1 Tax=Reichenbachiella ulvae TaxID=2980104 RepID=A0ABT3CSN9_9BACT|nr:hybrid sensor histidine kinase/response regulator transcription factor [Reichenbachiella ulvae]MCV9386697.1 ATP-binding protein [Reichenbachiella ulvae]